jgi:hypothetical protein
VYYGLRNGSLSGICYMFDSIGVGVDSCVLLGRGSLHGSRTGLMMDVIRRSKVKIYYFALQAA